MFVVFSVLQHGAQQRFASGCLAGRFACESFESSSSPGIQNSSTTWTFAGSFALWQVVMILMNVLQRLLCWWPWCWTLVCSKGSVIYSDVEGCRLKTVKSKTKKESLAVEVVEAWNVGFTNCSKLANLYLLPIYLKLNEIGRERKEKFDK